MTVIATIVPIKRLPSHLSRLDYLVPESIAGDIAVGQLVTIPLRKSTEFGLVLSTKDSVPEGVKGKLKPITTIEYTTPLVSSMHLDFMQKVSARYHTPLSTIVGMSLLPMQKRKLKKIAFDYIAPKRTRRSNKPPLFAHTKDEKNYSETIKKLLGPQTLILVPTMDRLKHVVNVIEQIDGHKPMSWHSSLTTKEKFERWMNIRTQENKIVIGTRSSVFLPWRDGLTIIVDRESNDNHKHWDGSPRFHALDAVKSLIKIHGGKLILLDHTPSIETYFHVHKGNYRTDNPLQFQETPESTTVVNMADERRGRNYDLFSETLKEKLLNLKGNAFLYMNRLGYATSVGCRSCGHVETCEHCKLPYVYIKKNDKLFCHYCKSNTDMQRNCPKCSASLLELRGAGTEQVETQLRKLLQGKNSHSVIRVDSRTPEPDAAALARPHILIGTQRALPYVQWGDTDVISFLDIDRELMIPEFNAISSVWSKIHEVVYKKNPAAHFFIQTLNTEQLIFRSLREPDRFYRTELNLRRSLGYPPYQYLVRYFYGHPNREQAQKQAEKLHALMADILQKEQFSATLSSPIEMHPQYYRGKFWYTILVKLDPKNATDQLERLNSIVPNTWRVDPNPNTILSP